MEKGEIIEYFKELFNNTNKGIERLVSNSTDERVLDRLLLITEEPLSKVQFNQLLMLSHESGVSDGFFKYYWLDRPVHIYDVSKLDDFCETFIEENFIISLQHLRWGLKRIYIDSLLSFGNIKNGFSFLKSKSYDELVNYFLSKRINTEMICMRGNPLDFKLISFGDRYLISEMACKSLGTSPKDKSQLKAHLLESYKKATSNGKKRVRVKNLLADKEIVIEGNYQQMFMFASEDILELEVESEEMLIEKCDDIADRYITARKYAFENTKLYLSLVNDLDVYVATSMRTKKDFVDMAHTCDDIFNNSILKDLHLRYFDPTISAADGHEDKGLIECLMVKCCKLLIYSAGDKESYGKDAEAAMALSLGKPVIFYCPSEQRRTFYKEVHPLSRLIDFNTGVAVGVLVTDRIEDVIELIRRIFYNDMQYKLEQPRPGYFKLKDSLTNSILRLQTDNELLF